MKKNVVNNVFIGIALVFVLLTGLTSGAIADRLFGIKPLDKYFPRVNTIEERIISEKSDVVDVVSEVGPSVVTISAIAPARRIIQLSPFGDIEQGTTEETPKDIGTGFVVSADGLIVTNKHVVANADISYKVSTSDGNTFDVGEISRDPSNDIAIIKIDAENLKPVELGDSSNLKVGQFVIAIGTALGEFRNTVTTGVISGLGRGIDANGFSGYVERLDNVIQTDAAINPGNSGGPLLNSAGEVIGVNVAVAEGANNIGFAIPINIVKDALAVFKETGKFPAKPFLGVEYQIISKQAALINEVPQGALIVNVIGDSPAEKAGIKTGDIIFKVDGQPLTEETVLSKIIADKKVGDTLALDVQRGKEEITITATLSEFSQ
ncbi:MAG TPA: trypsin-like peptidase domain-containing protein [Patescibacteria group bacterium]|nr:trypsin-like peptidase domain-containing protein [Patescibacteria group bacterium]